MKLVNPRNTQQGDLPWHVSAGGSVVTEAARWLRVWSRLYVSNCSLDIFDGFRPVLRRKETRCG